MIEKVSQAGYDLLTYLKGRELRPHIKSPFVILHGRVDGMIFFYGANITVEQVKNTLERPVFSPYYNGKFMMNIISDENGNPLMEIALEDRSEIRKANIKELFIMIARELAKIHSEYAHQLGKLGEKAHPVIVLKQSEAFSAGWKYRHM